MASIVATSKELFWAEVEQTTAIYLPDSPVIVREKLVHANAKCLQMEIFRTCTGITPFAQRIFSSLPISSLPISSPPMKVLDLGAGNGAYTLQMASSGAHVTAIDQSREFLVVIATKSAEIGCPSENLRLRRGDITTMESYDGPFNLVVAMDILPYVPPTKLRSTMEKIQQCLEDRGILIGTLFTTESLHPLVQELQEKAGAHFYKNSSEFITQLLEHSGFTVLELEEREEGGFSFKAEKAPVEKN